MRDGSDVRRGRLALLAVLASLAAAAPAAAGGTPHSLRADVAEWSIVPSTGVLRSGRVRIVVRNVGAEPHQATIVRTSRFADRLPLRGNRAVARPIAATRVLAPGATATLEVSLAPGSYVLLDNLPWHYWKGASVAFSVAA